MKVAWIILTLAGFLNAKLIIPNTDTIIEDMLNRSKAPMRYFLPKLEISAAFISTSDFEKNSDTEFRIEINAAWPFKDYSSDTLKLKSLILESLRSN